MLSVSVCLIDPLMEDCRFQCIYRSPLWTLIQFPSHLHQQLSVGQDTVLIGEGFPEVIKRGHAVPATRAETGCSKYAAIQSIISPRSRCLHHKENDMKLCSSCPWHYNSLHDTTHCRICVTKRRDICWLALSETLNCTWWGFKDLIKGRLCRAHYKCSRRDRQTLCL